MNATLFTLVRILLLLTCTNFVANDVAGKCGYATGGIKSNRAPGSGRGRHAGESQGSFEYKRSSTYRTVVAV
ncbi:unnamed product [Ostreococcus tauri]|uniref:Unnamed product n=1 Tax=Ostreococcus tauri TaxID=70448 RepID=A0A090M2U3_OSTTA|nr:unnamed product [Ostreococcus tauri]CEF96842.1 unnamed product [Ostreococcus tauri]|eukprot:XP_022838331.1 unnamed product [Ostreococcus tauri]